MDVHVIQDEALAVSGKRKGFDDAVRENHLFREAKETFSGNLVKGWTDFRYWMGVKTVTDAMGVRVLVGIEDRKLEGGNGQVRR